MNVEVHVNKVNKVSFVRLENKTMGFWNTTINADVDKIRMNLKTCVDVITFMLPTYDRISSNFVYKLRITNY